MKSSLLILLLFCLLCCKEKNPATGLTICGVKDPVRNLPWLNDLIVQAQKNNTAKYLTVTAVEIGEETVIDYSLVYMSCIGCVSYFCDGSRLDMSKYTQQELFEFQNNVRADNGKRIVLWPEK